MKLWKVDTTLSTVREVEGEPWPGKDAEGDTCYDNTHFRTESAACDRLAADVAARVSLAGADVHNAEYRLRQAHANAAEAAKGFEIGMTHVRRVRNREITNA
ncbi:MAG: hypothetical protein ACREO4_06445 [Lysobacter sp.]